MIGWLRNVRRKRSLSAMNLIRSTSLFLLLAAGLVTSSCMTVPGPYPPNQPYPPSNPPPPGPGPSQGNSIQSGTYIGQWKTGDNLTESVQVSQDRLVMTRLSGGVGQGRSVTYYKSGPNSYRNSGGSVINMTSPTTFTWINSDGKNTVGYKKLN